MMGIVQNVSYLGLLIQDSLFAYAYQGRSALALTLMIFFSVFYFAAIYFTFHAYREFKGMMIDHGAGAGGGGMMGLPSMGRAFSGGNSSQ
jgi:hypothetical protein